MFVSFDQPVLAPVALVRFHSDGGAGHGIWRGERLEAPARVDVELDVPGVHRWGEAIDAPAGAETGFHETPSGLELVGRVEALDADGMLFLRIAGGLVMVETVGSPWDDVVGSIVGLRPMALALFPTGTSVV